MATTWSPENATKAYLGAMKMQAKSANEPNGSEFISALAAGNNSQFIAVACGAAADSTTLSLVAAAQQTGGRFVCILRSIQDLRASEKALGLTDAGHVEFVVGDAMNLLLNNLYKESDFIAIDCNLENHETIINLLQEDKSRPRNVDAIVIGYNAFSSNSWRNFGSHAQILPIGEGLLVTRRAAERKNKSNWITKVDKCTGEEHVFRVIRGRIIELKS